MEEPTVPADNYMIGLTPLPGTWWVPARPDEDNEFQVVALLLARYPTTRGLFEDVTEAVDPLGRRYQVGVSPDPGTIYGRLELR